MLENNGGGIVQATECDLSSCLREEHWLVHRHFASRRKSNNGLIRAHLVPGWGHR